MKFNHRNYRAWILIIVVTVIAVSAMMFYSQAYSKILPKFPQTWQFDFSGTAQEPPLVDKPDMIEPKKKIILIWTNWYSKPIWQAFPHGYGPDKFSSCPVSNCITTNNRSLLNESDVVMFHTQPGDFHERDLPKYRWPHQRFTMFFFEPLMYSSPSTFNMAPAHFFNWTFTYRRFSDVASNQYIDYGFIPKSLDRKTAKYDENEESLEDYYGVNITGKKIMVAWFNSHCPTPVRREDFAAELAKYVQVDVYGECGKLKCAKQVNWEKGECDKLLKHDYLFYLSFENTFCPDYVTEKLSRPLQMGAVPIVFGGAHYSRFAPPHSYINALDFASPKELADYLIRLERNRKRYAHYFEWRRHFEMFKGTVDPWCQLCQMVNDDTLPPKTYANITKWWFDDYPCQNYKWRLDDPFRNGSSAVEYTV